ncbi:MAG: DHH family phosphoesterase [Coprobacillaceae bacterium]
MTKKMIQIRNVILGLLILEFVAIATIYLLVSTTTVFTLCVYVFIKNSICLGVVIYVAYILDKQQVSVGEVLSKDAENAFIFGGIGLIQYDEQRNITWISDLLQELDIHIIGSKILEWQPLLSSLFEDDDVQIIEIESRKYEVYNNKQTRLLYLKDVTDLLTITKEYEDQQLCVTYISIDNYDESIEHADEQKVASIQSTTRQFILDWAKENGIILRRYKSDGYIAVFNERIYHKQVELKFNVLDNFKEQVESLGEVMTLSIGIGRGSKVLRELDEMAFSALSLAYSRGGDQVTVKSHDEAIRFFGGNTESFEKNNKIRARVIAQSLAGLIKQADNILIMGHKQSDFDSFGASVAMHAICKAYEKPSNIIIDYDSLEEKTSLVAKQLRDNERYKGIFIHPSMVAEINTSRTLLIVVDNHKPSLAIDKSVLEIVKNIVVIDHHRRGEEFIQLPILTYLEPSASSTVELLVELLEYQKVDVYLTELEATIMYTGMLIDTNYFKTRVGARTFQAAAKLRDMQANVSLAQEYLEDDYETMLAKLSIKQNAYPYGEGILIGYGEQGKVYSRGLLAKAGNELMSIQDIKAAFVVGSISKTEIAISARSTKDVNVQVIMEKMGGGGHFSMAACQLQEEQVVVAINQLEEKINEYLDERGNEE